MKQDTVGARIRSARQARGITATFMAKNLGYKAVSSYTRLESDESQVTLEQAKKIADLLMTDVSDFLPQKLRDTRKVGAL